MAGTKLNGYGTGDVNLTKLMQSVDAQRKGFSALSLTYWDEGSAPSIAAGSVIENNGALYVFNADESISGSPSDGLVYVRLVPSGNLITAEYTSTEPEWSDEKQGLYGTGDYANYRYIPFKIRKLGYYYFKYRLSEKTYVSAYCAAQHYFAYPDQSKVVQFDATFEDFLVEFNTSTYQFTALEDGIYNVAAVVTAGPGSSGGNSNVVLCLRKNGSVVFTAPRELSSMHDGTYGYLYPTDCLVLNTNITLEAGDYIDILMKANNYHQLTTGEYIYIIGSGSIFYGDGGYPTYLTINKVSEERACLWRRRILA